MESLGVFYVRYMDDVLVLAPTHWKLRKAVRVLNQELSALKLDKHPDKTFIGRNERGFDFLGYHFSPAGLTVAAPTMARFVARAGQLYEQERRRRETGQEAVSSPSPFGAYVRRWQCWAKGGWRVPLGERAWLDIGDFLSGPPPTGVLPRG